MSKLALDGGKPVRTKAFPGWPIWDETEKKSLMETLESGQWGLYNSKISEFEKKYADFVGVNHCILVTSGTTALVISLIAGGIGEGDEVIIPPYTFTATAAAVLMMNAVPVFVDVDPGTYNMAPEEFEKAITERTKAVIPVHIAGGPADMDAIMAVAKKHDIFVIEDACQAHAAEWKDQKVGGIGNMGCFSFQASKNLCAGEGGAITTNDPELADRAWAYHNCGRSQDASRYETYGLGANFRMTAWQAAILLSQMTRLEEQTKTRNENGVYLSEKLAEIEGITPARRDEAITCHAYHLYMFQYDSSKFNNKPREKFLEALSAEGIPCSRGYHPLYKHDMFRKPIGGIDYSKINLPVTEKACNEEAVWLKQSTLLGTKEDMDDIITAVKKIKDNF
ncbi:aminotransferase class V-fold PLP-dependent enzyme [Candidatus Poribacteria bacterium]|nr:aminotransferase class V-fold PLP-dependent enzyme [Candidatus Poribacteria bacterium]